MIDSYKFLELKERLKILRDTLSRYEIKLAEIENARGVLERTDGKVYRVIGDLIFEVDRDEARDYLEKSELAFKSQVEKLKEEIEKVSSELRKMENEIAGKMAGMNAGV